jgi:hypothetical protein
MKLLSLKTALDGYHQRRANEHGYLYYLSRIIGPSQSWPDVVEGKSLATGRVVTLMAPYFEAKEVAEHAEKTQL